MSDQQPQVPHFAWWMWGLLFVGLILVITGFDPLGDALTRRFGPNANTWAINSIALGIIAYIFIRPLFNRRKR